MDTSSFLEMDADCFSTIENAMNLIFSNSLLWVTKVKEHKSWCAAATKEFFGLDAQIVFDFEQRILEKVHPRDRAEYLEGIQNRWQGQNLDTEMLISIRDLDDNYVMFSFHAKAFYDENQKLDRVGFVIKNESILPEMDALTNLYSYARYVKDLDEMIVSEDCLAILQIKVEGFNTFHLLYGLDYSNELLHAIAWRFIGMMDSQKCVYHMEGESFTFILKNADRQELIAFEQQVRQALEEGIQVAGKITSLKMAAGAILLGKNQADTSSIRGQVVYALDHSLHQHQGQLVIFNDEVQTSSGGDLALMRVIHQSVHNHCLGFYVEYQPIVDANDGTVVGAEALVRWKMEPYGKVPPGMFIEWMESDPSMYDLGNFVLRTALLETKHLLARKPDFFVNVNLSVRQLERPEFRAELQKILRETDFPAEHLCLELTERCKDIPLEKLREEVEYFQSCGIRVAMDDYGTGSASSNIVMNVPMDEIKIDMSFIRNIIDNPKNQEMVRSILYFAEKSNMTTCLEGVENEELQNYLRDYNATWFQGYYYAKPLPLSELEHMVGDSAN